MMCVNTNTVASSSSAAVVNHNNNNNEEIKPARPKRDFRFKVIEVQTGPKWFVWPSRNRGSSEDVDENHNKEAKKEEPDFATVSQNGYGALRRNVMRQSKRKQDQESIAQRTASEPAAARRIPTKKDKAVTEPISQVSSMFKIISIDKQWESFDVSDDDEENSNVRTISVTCLSDSGERRWTTSI
ncbi:unnamed protein product [Caenorhabditis bovis]|uniref:Uncharacterized protein n=1 Tax=Caenorhabditis bovis TaxID=2654633 RepID=A0A8S1FBS3_9PELO|nr:unnamed protein product [Caenorhabditis bovis]